MRWRRWVRFRSRVEKHVPAFALPGHGLVVGDVIASRIVSSRGPCGCRSNMAMSTPTSSWAANLLGNKRDLHGLAVPAGAALPLAHRRPRPYQRPHSLHQHYLLLFILSSSLQMSSQLRFCCEWTLSWADHKGKNAMGKEVWYLSTYRKLGGDDSTCFRDINQCKKSLLLCFPFCVG